MRVGRIDVSQGMYGNKVNRIKKSSKIRKDTLSSKGKKHEGSDRKSNKFKYVLEKMLSHT